MTFVPELLLAFPALGIAVSALVASQSQRSRAYAWIALGSATIAGLAPLFAVERFVGGPAAGRALWEWSAAGGPVVHATYHVDALALVGAAAVTLVTAAALQVVFAMRPRSPLLAPLILAQGFALLILVAVNDLVAGTLIAGTVAALTVAVGLLVAPAPAAARLAAALAFGVESLGVAALLAARFGIGTFDLDSIPSAAIGPGVLAMTALAGTLFCGLYPFVPWRYERQTAQVTSLGALRGALVFPTGIAVTVLALRLIAATRESPVTFPLPEIAEGWRAAVAVALLAVTAVAVVAGPAAARRRRAITGLALLLLLAATPRLGWSHAVALLALLTVGYASVASVAIPEEWAVARFDVRLAVIWAALAAGAPLALFGALLGVVASALSLAIEVAPVAVRSRTTAQAMARVLTVLGPFVALVGLASTPDPVVGALAGAVLLWAGLLEIGHAVRVTREEGWLPPNERWYGALAALASALLLLVAAGPAVARAARDALPTARADWSDPALLAIGALFAALTTSVVALPEIARFEVAWLVGPVRRVLVAADPVPAALIAYRFVEVWSRRAGAGFAAFEDRAGVWLATLLIALTLLWAATT